MTTQDAQAGYISSQGLGSTQIFFCGYCLPKSNQQRACLASTMSEVRRSRGAQLVPRKLRGQGWTLISSACSEVKAKSKKSYLGPSRLASEHPGSHQALAKDLDSSRPVRVWRRGLPLHGDEGADFAGLVCPDVYAFVIWRRDEGTVAVPIAHSCLSPCEGVSLQAEVSLGAQPKLSEGILAPACRA